ESDKLRRRFLREAQAAGRLSHPNIVTIYEASQADSLFYIAMELVDGGSLEALVSEGSAPVPVPQVCSWALQACLGLAEAHSEGVVHRDVKPANLLLTRGGQLKIADFGIAKVLSETMSQTQEGLIVGTVSYMSPEQVHS